ncbi:MAG: GNAT family protein [Chloroflexia bacterium]
MWVEPVILEGKTVRVEPLGVEHSAGLRKAYECDPSILRYHHIAPYDASDEAWSEYMQSSMNLPGRMPFAIVLKETGQAVGTTSYLDIRPEHRGLEIGYTWIGKDYQGTQVNPENKYLLLRHAFETLGAIRVQLKTDARNTQSQRAMSKLGAKLEGTLRNHVILPDGYYRHSVMFSITDDEWPEVKAALETRLGYVP